MIGFYKTEPCTSSDAFEIKFEEQVRIDLEKAAGALGSIGTVMAKTPVVLVLQSNNYNISVYASGRIMLKNVKKEEVDRLGKRIIDSLERGGALI